MNDARKKQTEKKNMPRNTQVIFNKYYCNNDMAACTYEQRHNERACQHTHELLFCHEFSFSSKMKK